MAVLATAALVGLGIQGVSALARGIKARKQRKEAEGIDDTRPEYQMPEEVLNNQAMFRALAGGRAPGAGIAENRINQASAEAVAGSQRVGGSAVNQLAAISGAQGAKQNALEGLTAQEQQFQQAMTGQLAQANTAVGAGRDVEFDYNQNQPFQYKRRKKNMLQSAADYNQMQMFDAISRGGSGLATYGTSMGGTLGKKVKN